MREKYFTRSEKKFLGIISALAAATLIYGISVLPSIHEKERKAHPERVYLDQGRGYLEDTTSPPDGIPDKRVEIYYIPTGSFQWDYPCTLEEIKYFQRYQEDKKTNRRYRFPK
ncbi:hypothetical protein HN832_04160 [archaeon]|jgi:hypothetical protein|nr:hypothetical protein [archaeon]MBT4373412.1 hypothetical protein [archaeon]MBT4531860.1 hypothetical protein [archaeon]MBT7001527.1 hypothetical protein [archaeon]MBT7282581.1 hypothetical protein [archaeon]